MKRVPPGLVEIGDPLTFLPNVINKARRARYLGKTRRYVGISMKGRALRGNETPQNYWSDAGRPNDNVLLHRA